VGPATTRRVRLQLPLRGPSGRQVVHRRWRCSFSRRRCGRIGGRRLQVVDCAAGRTPGGCGHPLSSSGRSGCIWISARYRDLPIVERGLSSDHRDRGPGRRTPRYGPAVSPEHCLSGASAPTPTEVEFLLPDQLSRPVWDLRRTRSPKYMDCKTLQIRGSRPALDVIFELRPCGLKPNTGLSSPWRQARF